MLELKNTVTEMKTAFHGVINRLDTCKEKKISKHEEVSVEASQIKIQSERTEYPRCVRQL